MNRSSPTLLEKALHNQEGRSRTKQPKDIPFYQKKWFWGVIAAAAVAVAIERNRDGRSGSEEPTVKEGF